MPTRPILLSANASWNLHHFRGGLIRALKVAGETVVTAAPDDAYRPRLAAMVDRHIGLPMQNAGTSFMQDAGLLYRYLQWLREVRPGVMLTFTIKPNIYGGFAARLLGIPIIQNVSGLGTAFIRDNWLTGVVKQLYRLAFRSSACVFFQNAEDRDLFVRLQLVAAEKTALLPGSGVDLEAFHPRYNVPRAADAPIAFVLIARLLWDKGIGEFVAAARMVKAAYPQAVFRLVGPGDVQNKTAIPKAQVAQWVAEGIIEYLGETEDVRAVLAQQDCVVLPSYREGMSRVLLEAAAMGKPLIATDVPGCRQVVEHEVNGLLCRVRDAQALADAMLQFLTLSPEQRAQMGEQSRAKAAREFDEQQVFDAYRARIAAVRLT